MTRIPRSFIALLTGLALLASGCSILGGDGTMEVQAEFRRTFNLFPQSPVRVLGVKVGQVVSLETSPGSDVVTVTMEVDEDVQLSDDSSAVILTASLLGERYVQLVDGDGETAIAEGALIPLDRTQVPFEFDEVLNGLNDFVGGLEEDEVGRLVTNLADLLEGNGAQLGETIDAASGAVAALKENDEELIELAGAVADLNETLATRDQELAVLLDDWISVTNTLTSESTDLDGALDNLVVLTREIAELMLDHREELSADVDTLTRVGRTLDRNLDYVSSSMLYAAELFRHADRVVDHESNMLPLVNHTEELVTSIEESLLNRLEGLCLGAGGSEDDCSLDALSDLLGDLEEGGEGGQLCLPPLVPCEDSANAVSFDEAITTGVEESPTLGEELLRRRQERRGTDEGASPSPEESAIDRALRGLGMLEEEEYR